MTDHIDTQDAVKAILRHIDPHPDREGLADTPRRFIKAMTELTEGYAADPGDHLGTDFDKAGYDGDVIVAGIPFVSLCEHHLLPFTGHVTVAYRPNLRVVGLSKIPRVVQGFARRLQIQEQLTEQIAHTIYTHLEAHGVAVAITAHHSCMSMRGIKSDGQMTTYATKGISSDGARDEIMAAHREAIR